MKNSNLFFLCLTFLLYGCFSSCKNISIKDVNKGNKITLKTTETKFPNGIHIEFIGQIDGDAFVTLDDGVSTSYKHRYYLAKGIVDYHINTEWYCDSCIVLYTPQSVNKGNLKIKYEYY